MMILQILSAFSAVLVFTMILEIPKKYMLYASASGAVGWWAYLMVQNSGHSSMLAAFLSTLVVAFLSHILAGSKKAPVISVSDHGNASGSAGSRHIPERLLFPPERLGAGYKKSSGDHPDRRSHCHGDLYHGLSVPAGSGL